jgi:N-acetyl sugar amidotransferase
MRYCTRCLIPETHETITFDSTGVCSICRGIEIKQSVDWDARKLELDKLVYNYKGSGGKYDAIVPISGGKDSVYTLLYLRQQYPDIQPLAVTFDHGYMRQQVQDNLRRTLHLLQTDHLSYKPSWGTTKTLMQESFARKGDFCWHCHAGVFAYPMWVAIEYQVPLVIWGEPSAEYTTYYGYNQMEEVDERRFNRVANMGINAEDMVGFLGGELTMTDLWPFAYPPLKALRELEYRSVCLGSYVPWNVRNQVAAIKRHLQWEGTDVEGVAPEYDYEKIECHLQGTRDYVRWLKRGYGRTAHLASIDIRNGVLTREQGERLVEENDGRRPETLDLFLKDMDMDEEEFRTTVAAHTVAPRRPEDWGETKNESGTGLSDIGTWGY